MLRLGLKSRKGVTETEVMTMVCILAAYLIILIFILPQILGMIINNFSLLSAEVVARDLASLISTGGIATDRISIYYNPSKSLAYNVEIKDKIVVVGLLNDEKKVREESSAKIAIDVPGNFEAKKYFTIEKSRDNGENIYRVEAK